MNHYVAQFLFTLYKWWVKKLHFLPIVLGDVSIDDILMFSIVSSGEKNYKYFIVYKYDDYKCYA